MGKKKHKEFITEVFNLVGNEYEVLGEYIKSNIKILFKHKNCNHNFPMTPNNFLSGNRCPNCFGNKKKTHEQFKKEVVDLVGSEYIVLEEYINAKTNILLHHIFCGNDFPMTPTHFLSGERCPYVLEI